MLGKGLDIKEDAQLGAGPGAQQSSHSQGSSPGSPGSPSLPAMDQSWLLPPGLLFGGLVLRMHGGGTAEAPGVLLGD